MQNPRKRLVLFLAAALILSIQGLALPVVQAAPTAIGSGDIALILYNSDNDALAFVALADISAGEEVYFTDKGWQASGSFRSNEGIIKWTAPAGGISAGTIVQRTAPFDSGDWSEPDSGFNLSTSGDQLLVYQGSESSPIFVYGLNNESAGVWQADATSSNTSALPTGLINGTTAVALDEDDSGVLTCTSNQTGSKAQLLAYISDNANWIMSGSDQSLDSNCSFTVTTGDTPPSVQATTPSDSAGDVPKTADIAITFSEDVTVTGAWFDITCTSSGTHPAGVSGGPQTYTLDPDSDFTFGESCTVTIEADQVEDQDDTPQTMAADYTFTFDISSCGSGYTPIHQIQGSGMTIALTGTQTVEGVVTLTTPEMNGFFLQSLTGDWDADDATSEGLFVYDGDLADSLSAGDHVRLAGTAQDYTSWSYGQMVQISELSLVTSSMVCATGVSVTPTTVNLPIPGDPTTYLERFEGMLITIPQILTVQQNYFQGRFGQLTLGSDGRIVTHLNGTGGTLEANLQRLIILDDASHDQNPDPIPYYAADGALRAGDTVTGITGVMDQGWINSSDPPSADQAFPNAYYRVHPTAAPVFTEANPRPASPPATTGSLSVAAFNVLNYFTTLDQTPYPVGSPYDGDTEPRGADNPEELARQQDKLVSALADLNADIVGLIEIEAWDGSGALDTLVLALNAELGGGTYAASSDPFNGTYDVIQQAFIYDSSTVTPLGAPQILTADPFDDYRPPVAQLFEENLTGEMFWVIVNHYKSKRCSGTPTGGDVNLGIGAGCYNATRVAMSTALLDWINNTLLPTDPDVLVIGDLNSYGGEDPITTLTGGGLSDQVAVFVPESERYSYVFDGMVGYLDHALTTTSLDSAVTEVAFWHINTDEPSVIDYNKEYKSVDLYMDHLYRSSDHDPLVISLNLSDSVTENYLPLILK